MSDFGIYEHVVVRESGKGSKVGKIFLMVLSALGILGLLWLGLIWNLFFLFLAIAVALTFLVFVLFQRYSSLEFEYIIAEGTISFAEIYGKRNRHATKEFEIRCCSVIAPIDDEKLKDYDAQEVYYAVSSLNAEHIYGAAYESSKGKKTIVYFEVTEQALRMCRAYNPRATVITVFS